MLFGVFWWKIQLIFLVKESVIDKEIENPEVYRIRLKEFYDFILRNFPFLPISH
jgi:hypothetical protein